MENLYPLEMIDDNPFQTRQGYDGAGIAELAADIYARGLLQPPVGRQVGERIELAFGHRRLRAYRHIVSHIDAMGWKAMPVNVQMLNDEQMALYAWSENAQRKDITAIEEAVAIKGMCERFGWSQSEIGFKLGIDRSTVANKLRLLKLPEDVQGRVASRELSERQAMALAPMYELPPATLKAYQAQAYVYPKPDELVKAAASRTSDMLRADVERVISGATGEIAPTWGAHEFDDRHMKAATCEACAERVKLTGGWRCTVKSCRERKQEKWQELRVWQAHVKSGIQPVGEPPLWEEYTTLQQVAQPERILEKRCENLRLRFNGSQGVSRLLVDGFEDVEIICLHGKGGRCTCASQAKAAATREANQAPDVQALKAERKRIEEELVGPAEAAALKALQANELGMWYGILRRMYWNGQKMPETWQECQEKIAHTLLEDAIGRWLRVPEPNYGTIKETAERKLQELGIEPPWRTTPLEELRRRWQRVQDFIDSREWLDYGVSSVTKALQGNLDNVKQLLEALETLRDESQEAVALAAELAVARDLLLRLLPIVDERNRRPWQSSDRNLTYTVRVLMDPEIEVGSVEFNAVLATADGLELRYALAMAQTDARVGSERIGALDARLRELQAQAEAPLVL